MSLISYVEPVSFGDAFVGLGSFIAAVVTTYIVYRLYFLDKIGSSHGVDLDKELVKRKMLESSKKKSFRSRIEKQIFDEAFGNNK